MTRRGPATRHTPATEPTAEVSGLGGRYRCDHRARHVWDNTTGREVAPEPDGSYILYHPDEDGDAYAIGRCLTRRVINEDAFGRATVGGFTITEARVVYDNQGRPAKLLSKPVGFGHTKHEKAAVRIDGELVLVDDLYTHAWLGESVTLAPRVPY